MSTSVGQVSGVTLLSLVKTEIERLSSENTVDGWTIIPYYFQTLDNSKEKSLGAGVRLKDATDTSLRSLQMQYPDSQGRTAEQAADYWRQAYWDMMYKRTPLDDGLLKQLQELNCAQASRIMELELLMSFITFTGDTMTVDGPRMVRLHNLIEQSQRTPVRVLSSLAESKWAHPPND